MIHRPSAQRYERDQCPPSSRLLPRSQLARVDDAAADAATVNAAIDVINDLLLGPTEYLVVATRER